MPKQYITDTEGQKISVILPMEEYIELMEDLKDLAAVAELRKDGNISIKSYGGIGGGVIDDTAAFIAASAVGLPIDLLGETYLIDTDTEITLTASLFNGKIIVGETPTGKIFKFSASGITVRDVIFTGGTTITAVPITALDGATDFWIINNSFSSFKNGGIVAQSGTSLGTIKDNKLYSCAAISSGSQYGPIICNANQSTINGNIITNGSQTGISLFAVTDVSISENIIIGDNTTNSGGIITDGLCTDIRINNNHVSNIQVEGIQVAGSISGYGSDTSAVIIADNTLTNCALAGIVLYGADSGGVSNVIIKGNKISSSSLTGTGIQVNRTSLVHIDNNQIIGYSSAINPINGAVTTNVRNNTFIGQSSSAISATSSSSIITGNYINGILESTTGISGNIAFGVNIIISDNIIDNCLLGAAIVFSTTTNSIYFKDNHFITNTTDYSWTNHRANSTYGNTFADQNLSGVVTLGGALTIVSTPVIKSTDRIRLNFIDPGTGSYLTVGAASIGRIDNLSQFLIVSTNSSDVSNYEWEIIR